MSAAASTNSPLGGSGGDSHCAAILLTTTVKRTQCANSFASPATVRGLRILAPSMLQAPRTVLVARAAAGAGVRTLRQTMAERRRGDLRIDPDDRPQRSDGGERRVQRRPRRWRRRLVRIALLLVLWGVIVGGGTVGYFALTLPPISDLTTADRRPSVTVARRRRQRHRHLWRSLRRGAAPQGLAGLPAGGGDRHRGPPLLPVISASTRSGSPAPLYVNLRAGHVVQGGSTITQQLAKNLFLTPDRTLKRKVQEALLALWLEHKFTKDQLLEIYLNRVYLGAGTYGVDAAAHRYFDKSARDVTLYEAAVIAGCSRRRRASARRATASAPPQRTAQVLINMVGGRLHHRGASRDRDAARNSSSPWRRGCGRAAAISPIGSTTRAAAMSAATMATAISSSSPRSIRACRRRPRRRSPRRCTRRRKGRCRAGRAGRHVARRRGARHGRRARLRREPVQPRDPGAAPAGLVLQALRLSRRARAWRDAL